MMASEDGYDRLPGDSNLPVPDPTRLTTQLVDRALASYREVAETRLDGMDRATQLVALDVAGITPATDAKLAHMREDFDRQLAGLREYILSQILNVSQVSLEKFAAVDARFVDRDDRAAETATQNRISLDAALAAAKEAVSEQNKANTLAIGKSEGATQKQIDAQAAQMATSYKALDDRITDLKERQSVREGHEQGSSTSKTERRLDVGQALMALSVLVGVVGLIIAAAVFSR